MYYLGNLRVRYYDVTKTDGKKSKTFGFIFWSTWDGSRRKWTLDVSFGKHLYAIWFSKEWVWGAI